MNWKILWNPVSTRGSQQNVIECEYLSFDVINCEISCDPRNWQCVLTFYNPLWLGYTNLLVKCRPSYTKIYPIVTKLN